MGTLKNKIVFCLLVLSMAVFLLVKTFVLIEYTPSTSTTRWTEFVCFFTFVVLFGMVVKDYIWDNKKGRRLAQYAKDLNYVLIKQTYNPLFYSGQVSEGAKALTKQVAESMYADRCSIWLYNDNKSSIVCDQLYIAGENAWYTGIELLRKDFAAYFDYLLTNPIIVADDAEVHPATSCFTEGYLKPLGIKSMLDVPIMYKGEIIGVICTENTTARVWKEVEINFAQLLSSLYTFSYSIKEINDLYEEVNKKNTYLEHAAKILRHDMHSGINTYIPRGIGSLERRLRPNDIANLKIEAPLKMIKEGLAHTQKVYKGVYEFTNLVKKDAVLNKELCNLKTVLESYLTSTSYKSQVIINDLPSTYVNEALFCTAVDNLIRNGLKYNDSDTKVVNVYMQDADTLAIQDNGRGITQEDFEHLSKPYTRKDGQKEAGTGLGLNICVAILEEHGFDISCEKNNIGTKMMIKIK